MTSEARPPFPPPVPTEDNQPFWDALREGRLVVQECVDCAHLVHPPRPMCPECGSFEKGWREMSGRGEVYSYVVTHQAIHPSFNGHTPYATALVRLEERLAELAPVVQQAAHHRARVEVLEATVAELEATLAKRDEALARLPELEARLERLGVERLALKERLRQLEEAVRLHAKPPTELGGILTTAFVGLAFVAFTMLLAWLTTH